MQKAIAIQVMTQLNKGILEAANFATSASQEVVRRWAFTYFCTLSQYPGSPDIIDKEYVKLELSSEQGKACGNVLSILHDEHFQLAAR